MGGDVQQDVGVPRQPEQEGHHQGFGAVLVGELGLEAGAKDRVNSHPYEHTDDYDHRTGVYWYMSQAMAGKSRSGGVHQVGARGRASWSRRRTGQRRGDRAGRSSARRPSACLRVMSTPQSQCENTSIFSSPNRS